MAKKRDYFWWIVLGFMIGIPVLNRGFWMLVAKLGGI